MRTFAGMMDILKNMNSPAGLATIKQQEEEEQPTLGFGHSGGSSPAYSDSWGIDVARDNPNGITGVTTSSGLGFSGNPEHFVTGQAARDLQAQMEASKAKAAAQAAAGGGFGFQAEEEAPKYEGTEVKSQTPFLDAYMRTRSEAREEGPVSKTMKKWME